MLLSLSRCCDLGPLQLDKVKFEGLVRAPGNVPVSLMLVVTVLLLVSVLAAAHIGAAAQSGGH